MTKTQGTGAAAPRAPALPWTVRLRIFGLVTAIDIAERPDGTVNRFVLSLADLQARASARPGKIEKARVRAHLAGRDGGRGCRHGEPTRGRDGLRHFPTASAGRASARIQTRASERREQRGTEISRWVIENASPV